MLNRYWLYKSVEKFSNYLKLKKNKKMDFETKNAQDWIKIQNDLFNNSIPDCKEWSNKSDIINVLNLIGKVKDSNEVLFSSGGGLDLEGAGNSYEKGCIELNFKYAYVVKPIKLLFQSFKDKPEWNYFRLETEELSPSGVYENDDDEQFDIEEVIELSPCYYISMAHDETKEYNGKELPETARIVIRASKGSYLIVQKSGPYNDNPASYNGLHTTMDHKEFHQLIIKASEL